MALSPRTLATLDRIHQGRRRGHAMVGQRAAGHTSEYAGSPIYRNTLAELRHGSVHACWYRLHGPSKYDFDKPGVWAVHLSACGHNSHFTAVVNDFGDLVKVAE